MRKLVLLGIVSGLWSGTGASVAADADGSYRIAVVGGVLRDSERVPADELAGVLRARGFDVRTLGAAALAAPKTLAEERPDLLVFCAAGAVPADVLPAVEAFVRGGGDVLALGSPFASEPLAKIGDTWMTYRAYREKLTALPAGRLLFDFENEDLGRWQRNCHDASRPFSSERVAGRTGGKAMHLHIHDLQGWDGFLSPPLEKPFPLGHTLTCLWVKGRPGRQNLSIEWREKDGSRWIAVFAVSEHWERVVLSPADFRYWQSTLGRGFPGDQFKPENAVRLNIGMSWTHTGQETGEHEFFIDELGTLADPNGETSRVLISPPPAMDGLCPSYKFYEMNEVASLGWRAPASGGALPLPKAGTMRAHHPRPTGKGLGKHRGWRWIPIVEAFGPKGEWRGSPVSMFVDFGGPKKGSVRATFSISDADWYRTPAVLTLIGDVVERMARGAFFEEAGAEFFTYRPGESVTLGAKIRGLTGRQGSLVLRIAVAAEGSSEPIRTIEMPALEGGGWLEYDFSRTVDLPESGDDFVVTARLLDGDRVVDEVSHELGVLRHKRERQYMTYGGGDFLLGGRRWYAHGVNYMPSTGIGTEDQPYFEHWIGAAAYDPEFIQRDLERCRDIGFNTVSIFIYHSSVKANNLIDILRRCERLGLKVNLSIRPGTPMAYDPAQWEEIIRFNRLWEFDTIYAYDIAWEPFFGTHEERRKYDPQWKTWIEQRHGSLADAEKAWGMPAPKAGGEITNPGPDLLGRDGPHRALVSDYRRFVDDLLHEKYGAAAKRILAVDPNHLISFRMTETSDPTYLGENLMNYDFAGVARAMDFLAPEAYGRIGTWDRVRDGMFQIAYARMCAPDKPVIWAEAGMSAWDKQEAAYSPRLAKEQADFFRAFYRMVLESGSNGVVWWWYPGGYRTNEDSDFGIIHPDGTDRLCTQVIREFAPKMVADREIPRPNAWLEMCRDADARGLYGEYERLKADYWRLVESGKVVGLRQK